MRLTNLFGLAREVIGGLAATLSGRREPAVMLEPGSIAPDFSLQGSDGRRHALADHAGLRAVVVAWFPRAFTGGCTIECRALGESKSAIRAFDVAYFAASVDDVATNTRFAEEIGATYPILSDPDKRVARAYGVLGIAGLPSRWTFYIGADGRILYIDKSVHVTSAGADVAARLAALGIKQERPTSS